MNVKDFCETVFDKTECICGNSHDECTKTVCQLANVSVPIRLKPCVTVDDITAECCEAPVIECRAGRCKNSFEITVTQKISVNIPINYKIDACVGESVIDAANKMY